MTAEEKCNRCEQFGPNGLTDYPCKRVPTRSCPYFLKISEKKYKKILAERVRKIKGFEKMKENEKIKERILKTYKPDINLIIK